MKTVIRNILCFVCALALVLGAAACSKGPATSSEAQTLPEIGPGGYEPTANASSAEETAAPTNTAEPTPAIISQDYETPYDTSARITRGTNGRVIVIDAGHQGKANTEKEPVGPGSSEMKTKVSTGTQGRFTNVPEYQVNLSVALLLEQELVQRGYTVLMVRTTHDVNISNVERAEMANGIGADAFIRIHCNGVDKESVNGCGAICQSRNNPYVGKMYDTNFSLNNTIVNAICEATGQNKYGVIAEDNMAGINWCVVPAALIELGFMTNEAEDRLLVTEDYQKKAAYGMANGIDEWLMAHPNAPKLTEPAETEPPAETTAAESAAPETSPEETTAAPAAETVPVSDGLPADRTNYVTSGTNGYVIVIDPGHQAKANSAQEPVGPGASQTKAKVSSGTASRYTGKAEYQVNLEVALKLRTELLKRGYTVIMTRTGHNVDISNVERAAIANDANADAFLRIHCNGSDNTSFNGIGIYYQTPSNPYNAALHDEAKALNACLLKHMLERTGARSDGLIENDSYSGINWCKVPAGLIEMGYMTNEAEDRLLQDGDYQTKLALGMADGVDEFLSTRAPKNR